VRSRPNPPEFSSRAGATQTAPTWDAIGAELGSALQPGREPESLRALVRLWCEEARRRDLAPEQFLVVLKSQFARVPELRRRAGDEPAHNALMERIVTMCIEEYFRPV
jgi:hypothetical protein